MSSTQIKPASPEDWQWIDQNADAVGGPRVVSCGTLYTLRDHEGFVAVLDNERLGFAVLRKDELLAIVANDRGHGIGSALMDHCESLARSRGHRSIWLVTTNDNLDAMRFYQRRGYTFDELHQGAFEEVRRLKNIEGEVLGNFGIPIKDELVFRKTLKA